MIQHNKLPRLKYLGIKGVHLANAKNWLHKLAIIMHENRGRHRHHNQPQTPLYQSIASQFVVIAIIAVHRGMKFFYHKKKIENHVFSK